MSKVPVLDQETLKEMLHYDPETGIFRWLVRSDVRPQWNGRYAGKGAGYARKATGGGMYWSIRIYDWPFHANRLAWLYMTGEWPKDIVDHRDLDGLNNRWSNLREATKSQNAANAPAHRTNTSGFKGVSFCRKRGLFRATIRVDERQKWLGYHKSPEAAHEAYKAAAVKKSGEFARWQ